MKSIIRFIPLILFVLLGVLLYRGLFLNPQAMPSAMIGKPLPNFELPILKSTDRLVGREDLTGNIVLLNVWATWCIQCKYEHPYLLDIIRDSRIKLYGLNFTDDRNAALNWLKQYEDPYEFSIFDEQGALGLDIGVFGAPETFVIDHTGIIRKRFAGPINDQVWKKEFLPLIDTIEAEIAQGST
ncbi:MULTISPECIES: DsbE family thiol:disulfide interchange protein [Colwelliaceae]|uniref:DsbE family thiol:disulfide interchange protein n=1 Tax=Cognaticolwellia beringensis TaxID=1967665 RepID=A0A222GA95_9GAMM|nr:MULTISPECIES: DsbE family thiol:disulfide interchange protein [Colwelliaceae]ARD45175.1 thiol:disulfide interchange protein [Colwellia sp. PAMC 21821]ASP48642.1 DsbE family thiol:disulfide interchange protein [Cognaticolwellia beringensis]